MTVLLAVILCALGHLVRDGVPGLRSTQSARAVGGLLCTGAALCAHPGWLGFTLGAALWAGFYGDQMHGEGQQAESWQDAGWLALSGVTSLAPLALLEGLLLGPWHALVVLVGLAKIPLWFGAWRLQPARWWTALYATRLAAVLFGAVVGIAIAF